MLLLINRRYPVLGAVLSVISNVAFIAFGVAEHSALIVVTSALFLALPIARTGSQPAAQYPAGPSVSRLPESWTRPGRSRDRSRHPVRRGPAAGPAGGSVR